MTKVVSFANQKGGVGKSTLCIQTAFYLSLKKGKRVLVIDMDGQGNTSSRLAPRDPETSEGIRPIFSGTKTADLFEEQAKVEVMACPTGMDLIHTPKNDPALFEKEAIPLELAMLPAKHLRPLFKNYDYVLVDCPPSLGRKLIAALVMSTDVVCPVKLSGFAVDGVEGLLQTIIGIREAYNKGLNILGILINDMDRSVNHDRSLQELEDQVPELLFRTKIMHRPPLDSAVTEGVPVWELRYGHVAAKEVETAIEELLQKVG